MAIGVLVFSWSVRYLTEKKAISAASRSIAECIASEMILTDCVTMPTNNFIMIKNVLEIIR
jgi:hypothetical protein